MFRIRNKTFHFQYKSTYASEKSLGKKSHNGFMKFSHNPHNEHPHEKGERENLLPKMKTQNFLSLCEGALWLANIFL
jgi:hypothetical protein